MSYVPRPVSRLLRVARLGSQELGTLTFLDVLRVWRLPRYRPRRRPQVFVAVQPRKLVPRATVTAGYSAQPTSGTEPKAGVHPRNRVVTTAQGTRLPASLALRTLGRQTGTLAFLRVPPARAPDRLGGAPAAVVVPSRPRPGASRRSPAPECADASARHNPDRARSLSRPPSRAEMAAPIHSQRIPSPDASTGRPHTPAPTAQSPYPAFSETDSDSRADSRVESVLSCRRRCDACSGRVELSGALRRVSLLRHCRIVAPMLVRQARVSRVCELLSRVSIVHTRIQYDTFSQYCYDTD